jgi:hypothetical protein
MNIAIDNFTVFFLLYYRLAGIRRLNLKLLLKEVKMLEIYFYIIILTLSNYCSICLKNSINQNVFDLFFTTKLVSSDTALKLAISYKIVVEKHHDRLACISELGQGPEFLIEILLKQGTQQK